MRLEVALSIVAEHVPLARRWRLVVCQEVRDVVAPTQEALQSLRAVQRAWRRWRKVLRPPPRRRVASWHRRLHNMEAPILVCN